MNPLIRSSWYVTPAVCLFLTYAALAKDPPASPAANPSKHTTEWRIEPSVKYDALCLLNTLTGDSYYQAYYSKAFALFSPSLTPEARTALEHVKKVIKDDTGGIISANLCLMFSATDDQTLDQILATVDNPEKLRANFSQTPYWSEEGWQRFELIRDDLRVILKWYKSIDFENYWGKKSRPLADASIKKMLARVSKFDVVPLIEQHLGRSLGSNTITVYMLTYSQPHGIRITGTRFLTDVAWPYEIVVRNAVHEMMHPPYFLEGDKDLREVLDTFRSDKFFMDKVEHHNPSFGYNSLEGFVDEDCVQALDQLINEKLGVASKPAARWKQSDDGMHVLAVALYQIMKEEKYPSAKDKSFRDFLVRMNKEGKFKEGSIERYYRQLYGKK